MVHFDQFDGLPMRVLITGSNGFTGRHLVAKCLSLGWSVDQSTCDLQNSNELRRQVCEAKPDVVFHLAGISTTTHPIVDDYYTINVVGTINLLESIKDLKDSNIRVVVASSASVYGNVPGFLSESNCPNPVSNYAISKLAMEHVALTYSSAFSICIARPFNYTGLGQSTDFVIPKIVDHFRRRTSCIELGNTIVEREYNDVRDICEMYVRLLKSGCSGKVYNFCTGRVFSLNDVLEKMVAKTGFSPEVVVNPAFLRKNEIFRLAGDPTALNADIGSLEPFSLDQTLEWMLKAEPNG